MLEGGDPKAMLGVMKVLRIMIFASNSFYCLQLLIYLLLKGGDPKVMLGVMEVLRLMLLRSKLFLLSPAPNPSNARGR